MFERNQTTSFLRAHSGNLLYSLIYIDLQVDLIGCHGWIIVCVREILI